MIATSGFLTALECTQFVCGPRWGISHGPANLFKGLLPLGEGEKNVISRHKG